MTEIQLRKYLGKASYDTEDLPKLRDLARKLKHDLDISNKEIRRLRRGIEKWKEYHKKYPPLYCTCGHTKYWHNESDSKTENGCHVCDCKEFKEDAWWNEKMYIGKARRSHDTN